MNKESALDKIKKLLRMKRGGTPAEIETALALARDIASKHGIDIGSVDPEEKLKSELGHEHGYIASRVPYDVRYAAKLAEMFFNVDVIYQKDYIRGVNAEGYSYYRRQTHYKLAFVGRKFEIEIAIYVFRFICGHFRRSWHRRTNRRLQARQSFVYGMFNGIIHKLRSEQPTVESPEADLALIVSRRHYIEKAIGKTKTTQGEAPEVADAAALAGYAAGLATNLRKGVQGGEKQTLQLT